MTTSTKSSGYVSTNSEWHSLIYESFLLLTINARDQIGVINKMRKTNVLGKLLIVLNLVLAIPNITMSRA